MLKVLFTAIALLSSISVANACHFGTRNLPGSLGAGQSDNSRSFTISAYSSARFIVQVRTGGPITANIGCGWRTARYHSCRVYNNNGFRRETFVRLRNNVGRQITYRWICRF